MRELKKTSQGLNPQQWVDTYADLLYGFAFGRVNNKHLAEDIVQETFLSAWKGRETYNRDSSERTWLFSICKNKIIDHYRKRKNDIHENNDHHYFDNADHWTTRAQPSYWSIDYDQPMVNIEFYAALSHCCDKLKGMQHLVFSMKYLDELNAEEVCSSLDISAGNYWVLLHRAKLQLRGCLEKNWINK